MLKLISAFVLISFLGACSSVSKDRFLISFYNLPTPTDEIVSSLVEDDIHGVTDMDVNFITPPIENRGAINNPALPNYVGRLPGNYLTISRYASQKELDTYLAKRSPIIMSGTKLIETRAIVTAKIFKPMPIMPDAPILGDVEPRPEPSFLLLNGITMNSMANPMTPIRMMRYMSANLKKLEAEGVQLLEAFQVTDTVMGTYGYDMLFLTEWPDQETFDRIHNDPDFIRLAEKTRNRAFKAFADDKGVIRTDLP